MQIFNKQIFGDVAEGFCALPKELKVAWIKKYTNQQNDTVINAFLDNPIKEHDCGCGCGGKNKANGNISKSDAVETITSSQSELVGNESKGDSSKRPKKTKRTKN